MTKWVQNRNGVLIPNREAGFIQPGIGLMNKKQGGSGGDPYWSNVKALLYFEGADGGTVFTDETGRIWTRRGTATTSTAQEKFGTSSLRLVNGTTDGISVAASLVTTTGDYTIEGFSYRTANKTGYACIFCITSTYGIFFENGSLVFYSAGDKINAGNPGINTWHHIAFVRKNATSNLYIDGVLKGSVATNMVGSSSMYIGTDNVNEGYIGWIDCVRITDGVARYNGNFTPPTTPFPNHA